MGQTTVLTSLVPAVEGLIADDGRDMNFASYVNQEASNTLPFGRMVMQGAQDLGDNLLTAGNVLKIVGLVTYSSAFQVGNELASVADANGKFGLMPGTMHNLMKRGRAWVLCEEAVTPASTVRVRCTAAGNGQGSFRTTSAGGGLSMVLTGARYLDTAAIGGYSRVELDVLGRNTWTAD